MKVIPTAIEGVVILEPEVFGDARGYFFESYSQRKFDEQVRLVRFVQDNESFALRRTAGPPFSEGPLRPVETRARDPGMCARRRG